MCNWPEDWGGGSVFLPLVDVSEGKAVGQTRRAAGNVPRAELRRSPFQSESSGGSAANASAHFQASENVETAAGTISCGHAGVPGNIGYRLNAVSA